MKVVLMNLYFTHALAAAPWLLLAARLLTLLLSIRRLRGSRPLHCFWSPSTCVHPLRTIVRLTGAQKNHNKQIHLGNARENVRRRDLGDRHFVCTNFSHSSLSWGSSRGISVVFEAPGALKCARSCEAPPRQLRQQQARRSKVHREGLWGFTRGETPSLSPSLSFKPPFEPPPLTPLSPLLPLKPPLNLPLNLPLNPLPLNPSPFNPSRLNPPLPFHFHFQFPPSPLPGSPGGLPGVSRGSLGGLSGCLKVEPRRVGP